MDELASTYLIQSNRYFMTDAGCNWQCESYHYQQFGVKHAYGGYQFFRMFVFRFVRRGLRDFQDRCFC